MNISNKYYMIVNPAAGNGRYSKYEKFINRTAENLGMELNIQKTEGPGHATEIVSGITEEKSNIIAVGGDGTVHEVINGINLDKEPRVGVLPLGTGNDFSFELYGKLKLKEICEVMNDPTKIRKVNVCFVEYKENSGDKVNSMRMINNFGIGFDAYVSYLNNQNKYFTGVVSYVISVFKALRAIIPLEIEIKIDKIEMEVKSLLLAAIGNGRRAGGGFYLNPRAKIDDDLLDISTLSNMKAFKLLRRLPLALIDKVEKIPEAVIKQFKSIEINFKKPHYVHCDGEFISKDIDWMRISILDKKMIFFSV